MAIMKIYTESGSHYEIDNGICRKFNSEGMGVDAFKVFAMKAIDPNIKSMKEVWTAPDAEPEVGKLLYISGLNSWWLSTPVVRIEY